MAKPTGLPRTTADQRIGANVRSRRQRRQWTLAQLAEAVGEAGGYLSVAQLSKIELGKRGVGADDLEVLAIALAVSTDQLLVPPDEEALDILRAIAGETLTIAELTVKLEAGMREAFDQLDRASTVARDILDEHPEIRSSLSRDEQTAIDDLLGVPALRDRESQS